MVLKSTSIVRVIDVLCEGPIQELVGWKKGVYLNETPVEDSSSSPEDRKYNFTETIEKPGEDPKEVFQSLYQLIPVIQSGFATKQEAINALDQRAQNEAKQGYPMEPAVYNALYDEIKESFKQQENFKEYQNYLKFFQTGQQ